jgi:uncharacterized protein YndB with AHSA1/START domain
VGDAPRGLRACGRDQVQLIADGEHRGWRGFVECEVLEVEHERLLKISWVGDEKVKPQTVTYRLADDGAGTRLTLDHEGFEGLGGFMLSKFILKPGWKVMLRKRLAKVIGGVE